LTATTASACAAGYFLTTSTATPPVSTCATCAGTGPLSV